MSTIIGRNGHVVIINGQPIVYIFYYTYLQIWKKISVLTNINKKSKYSKIENWVGIPNLLHNKVIESSHTNQKKNY